MTDATTRDPPTIDPESRDPAIRDPVPGRVPRILVLGGGSAGITALARLRRALRPGEAELVLVEPSETHYYQPLWTLVGAGVLPKERTARSEARVVPPGVRWVRHRVAAIDPDARLVRLEHGEALAYDRLVVALGIHLDWDRIEGLREALATPEVGSNYSFDTVDETWRAFRAFEGGTAVFTNPAGQVKCGGAPQKIMYLFEEYARRRGLRERTRVVGAFAGTMMLGVPEINATLERIVHDRGIEMRFRRELVAIDPERRVATFELLGEAGPGHEEIRYDFLHVTPPQRAPDAVARSALGVPEGPHAGFVEVDPATLRSPRYPDVWALGDVAALPTAKTGAAVRKQAPVLVKHLVASLRGAAAEARYDGYSSCPLVTGYGRLVLAEFTYGNRYHPTFPVDQTRERRDMYLLKRWLLPLLYWHGMLRGRA